MPHHQTTANNNAGPIARICEAIRARQRFVISSHSRPDGDSIGSQLAMAFALRALGKHVEVVNQDAAPPALMAFPGVPSIRVAERVDGEFDAAIIMECSDLKRTGVDGLEQYFVINIDHHPGNSDFGAINWFDAGAAACAEMVFDVIRALDVPLSVEMATHIYMGILTAEGRAQHLRQQHARPAEAVRGGAGLHRARTRRAARRRLREPRDGRRRGRNL